MIRPSFVLYQPNDTKYIWIKLWSNTYFKLHNCVQVGDNPLQTHPLHLFVIGIRSCFNYLLVKGNLSVDTNCFISLFTLQTLKKSFAQIDLKSWRDIQTLLILFSSIFCISFVPSSSSTTSYNILLLVIGLLNHTSYKFAKTKTLVVV